MEPFLMKALQLIVALAFLVIIHEFGHYIIARMFGIKVEKFYLFFNPWFSLFKWKPKKGKPKYDKNGNERATWRDTEYGIGWLPLGGYVKIAGMIDESMDKEQMKQPAQPWEFRSKPAYQRLLVMIGGVLFNFILAILIYAGIAFWWGMTYRQPVVVDKVQGMSPASEAGIKENDRIVKIDTLSTRAYSELTSALQKYAGKKTTVTVERDGKAITMPITPNEGGKLGFQLKRITDVYPTVTVNYGFFRSFPKGVENGTKMLTNYVSSMKHVFTKEGATSIGGFGAIGDMFPERWNWLSFWEITAFLSVALAFMNILPIPALDGGHVLFLLYEIITRRKPAEKVLEYAQVAGMFFLLALLLYANGADIVRALF